ncbi:MAG: hypothetical protein ACXVAE_06815 [Candidatus Limnocylindrales bacterium]|jgi:hypothetical protein
MYPRDRALNLGLLGLAAGTWLAVAILLTTRYPDSLLLQAVGAGLIGLALGLTCVPLAWLGAFALHRGIAYRGDWVRAARRGAWIGALTAFLLLLREQGALSLPIALFVCAMALFVEVSLSVER